LEKNVKIKGGGGGEREREREKKRKEKKKKRTKNSEENENKCKTNSGKKNLKKDVLGHFRIFLFSFFLNVLPFSFFFNF
jgi:hypothetical protein